MKPLTILVATDFSPAARPALERAVQLARAHGARLQLVHAFDATRWKNLRELAMPKKRLLADQPNARAGAALHALAERLQREHGIQVSARMAMGRAARAIAAAARSAQAALVVLGPHGHRKGDGLFLGSTALGVVRSVACPVLVVRNAAAAPYGHVLVGM
ncbi:MAG: universal stress protein, partial [Rubrivivax sp.]|nr:universal stress protein [Rubrivivax sp.]